MVRSINQAMAVEAALGDPEERGRRSAIFIREVRENIHTAHSHRPCTPPIHTCGRAQVLENMQAMHANLDEHRNQRRSAPPATLALRPVT